MVPPTFSNIVLVVIMPLSKIAQNSSDNQASVDGVESALASLNGSGGDRFLRVAICAYYKTEACGFELGHEMEDWLAAEEEVNQ